MKRYDDSFHNISQPWSMLRIRWSYFHVLPAIWHRDTPRFSQKESRIKSYMSLRGNSSSLTKLLRYILESVFGSFWSPEHGDAEEPSCCLGWAGAHRWHTLDDEDQIGNDSNDSNDLPSSPCSVLITTKKSHERLQHASRTKVGLATSHATRVARSLVHMLRRSGDILWRHTSIHTLHFLN